ncbi:SufE family protein [Notoacmeibacter ruber]|uniref:SufE family protein n=1 Tax=Notoacmeibacter ruber TaxID=2670375 RepID=A0A3L7JAL9_9HYPH|nr:SufE family protein [Notoacmeibacter ruber]RLQ87520.1 SufE family protein [Notoacmeibacter ruber]
MDTAPDFAAIRDDFELLDDWEDRYRYVIELGRDLPDFPDEWRTEAYRVKGCVSQVWLHTDEVATPDGPVLQFRGDSDAHIVKGLVAIILSIFSGKTVDTILETDAVSLLEEIGLSENITPQRANGIRAMIERIKTEAAALKVSES